MKKEIDTLQGKLRFVSHLLFSGTEASQSRKYLRQVKKYPYLPLYMSRFLELVNNYPISLREFVKTSKENDFPNSEFFKEKFLAEFGPSDPKSLYASYLEKDDLYTLRLMLTYHRIDYISPYLEKIESLHDTPLNVLDYGGGVSDIGLLFAARGHNVTLYELDTPKAKFAKKRYLSRGLNCTVVTTQDTEVLPELDTKYDIIIGTEIIEHYRYPTKLVNYFYDHLKPGGLLLNSMGEGFERERGADHLDESLDEGNSNMYKENYQKKFRLVPVSGANDWLFEKIS